MKPCPIRDCDRTARSNQVMCFEHWALVPKVLQKLIWQLWRQGNPEAGHGEAVANAIEQVNARVAARIGSLL